jgi:hypothetical protein
VRLLWRWPLFSTYVGLTICVALVVTVRVSFGPAPWDIEEATAIYLTILGLPWSAWLSGWWLIAGVAINALLLLAGGRLAESLRGPA